MTKKIIDLNCDLGELDTAEALQRDSRLMPFLSRCNIACGGHAGSPESMKTSINNAKLNNLRIGAHPSYPDRENFGRKVIDITFEDLQISLSQQVQNISEIALQLDAPISHVKFHGALYNEIEANAGLANKISQWCGINYPQLELVGLAGGELEKACLAVNINFVSEGFIDRKYQSDGKLSSRNIDGSTIENIDEVIQQALALAKNKKIETIDHCFIAPKISTLCLHSDHQNSEQIAEQLYRSLEFNGFKIL